MSESITSEPTGAAATGAGATGTDRRDDAALWEPFDVALKDGGLVRLRPVVPDDRARIVAGFARLSPESRRLRFHEPRQALTSAELDFLSTIDQQRHVSWAACLPDGSGVGIGRYVVDPSPSGAPSGVGPQAAEIALAVVDEHQRRGIGRALLRRLAVVAAARGLTTFHATVLSENRAMRTLIERHAASAAATAGVLRVEIPVAALLADDPPA